MILDTSALVAVLYKEPERDEFLKLIHEAEECLMSVASFLELSMVVERQLGPDAARQVDTFLLRAGVNLVAVTVQQGQLARQAFLDYGKGRHSAGLNLGDCFAYALARESGHPLLFKGNHFSQTDLTSARLSG